MKTKDSEWKTTFKDLIVWECGDIDFSASDERLRLLLSSEAVLKGERRRIIEQIRTEVKADWLRSEIEKLEIDIKTGNNGEGLPFENSPEIYGNARMEAWKNGYNTALTSIITRYKEELLELDRKEV